MTITDIRPTDSGDARASAFENAVSARTTNGCYLPWFEECYPAAALDLGANDVGHAYTGAMKIIETASFNSGGVDGPGLTIHNTVSVAVHRFDDDLPGRPVTGEGIRVPGTESDDLYSTDGLVVGSVPGLIRELMSGEIWHRTLHGGAQSSGTRRHHRVLLPPRRRRAAPASVGERDR